MATQTPPHTNRGLATPNVWLRQTTGLFQRGVPLLPRTGVLVAVVVTAGGGVEVLGPRGALRAGIVGSRIAEVVVGRCLGLQHVHARHGEHPFVGRWQQRHTWLGSGAKAGVRELHTRVTLGLGLGLGSRTRV